MSCRLEQNQEQHETNIACLLIIGALTRPMCDSKIRKAPTSHKYPRTPMVLPKAIESPKLGQNCKIGPKARRFERGGGLSGFRRVPPPSRTSRMAPPGARRKGASHLAFALESSLCETCVSAPGSWNLSAGGKKPADKQLGLLLGPIYSESAIGNLFEGSFRGQACQGTSTFGERLRSSFLPRDL